jgi:hypothetical protein
MSSQHKALLHGGADRASIHRPDRASPCIGDANPQVRALSSEDALRPSAVEYLGVPPARYAGVVGSAPPSQTPEGRSRLNQWVPRWRRTTLLCRVRADGSRHSSPIVPIALHLRRPQGPLPAARELTARWTEAYNTPKCERRWEA